MTLIKPKITEKSMIHATRGQYTFVVQGDATKHQIKEAVKTAFKVKITSVNVSNRHIPGKSTGSKRLVGSPSKSKIAIVTLQKGQTIDLFDLKEDQAKGRQGK